MRMTGGCYFTEAVPLGHLEFCCVFVYFHQLIPEEYEPEEILFSTTLELQNYLHMPIFLMGCKVDENNPSSRKPHFIGSSIMTQVRTLLTSPTSALHVNSFLCTIESTDSKISVSRLGMVSRLKAARWAAGTATCGSMSRPSAFLCFVWSKDAPKNNCFYW